MYLYSHWVATSHGYIAKQLLQLQLAAGISYVVNNQLNITIQLFNLSPIHNQFTSCIAKQVQLAIQLQLQLTISYQISIVIITQSTLHITKQLTTLQIYSYLHQLDTIASQLAIMAPNGKSVMAIVKQLAVFMFSYSYSQFV